MKIQCAIIPAAGLGTRFLPYTKAVPKELLPLIDIPAIHRIAQECADSGITSVEIIISPGKEALQHYFSPDKSLDTFLAQKNKEHLLTSLNNLISNLSFSYSLQEKPLGLGHAILCAKNSVKDGYCAVLLPDDIIVASTPGIAQLLAIAQKHQASVIAVQEVPLESVSSYGVVSYQEQLDENCYVINDLVEKPQQKDAPSNLAIIGRYILSAGIFKALENTSPGAGGEIQLTDGIRRLLKSGEKIIAYKIQGKRYDIGNPQGWVAAVNHFEKEL